jgi:hypothetical protein
MPSGKRGESSFGSLSSVLRHSFASKSGADEACPGADDLGAYFDHTLREVEAKRLETHFAGCPECRMQLAIMARSATPLGTEPGRGRKWLRLWNPVWLVPAAALIVAALWTGIHWPLNRGAKAHPSASPPAIVAMTQQATASESARQAATPAPVYGAGLHGRARKSSGRALTSAKSAAPNSPAPPAELRAEREAEKTPAANSLLKQAGPASEVTDETAQVASSAEMQATDAAPPQVLSTPSAAPASSAKKVQRLGGAPGALSRQMGAELETVRAIPETVVIAAPGAAVEWRVGPRGSIEGSSDGQNWSRQNSGTSADLFGGFAVSDKVCWIVGRAGTVLLTTDGQTWRRVNAPSKLDLVSVTAQNEKSATVGAAGGHSYRTDDGGQTWHTR